MAFDYSIAAATPTDHLHPPPPLPSHQTYVDAYDIKILPMPGSTTTTAAAAFQRLLQDGDMQPRGQTVLTVLYLCLLGMCFVIPVFFYLRMHCDDRHNRRMREVESVGLAHAVAASHNTSQHQREESRATRRKYREERRARILQLFTPVRTVRGHCFNDVLDCRGGVS
jgi:hypothetical protein